MYLCACWLRGGARHAALEIRFDKVLSAERVVDPWRREEKTSPVLESSAAARQGEGAAALSDYAAITLRRERQHVRTIGECPGRASPPFLSLLAALAEWRRYDAVVSRFTGSAPVGVVGALAGIAECSPRYRIALRRRSGSICCALRLPDLASRHLACVW